MGELKVEHQLVDDGMGVTIEALFRGMQGLVQSKTVVGEPIRVDGATIIPLIEVTAGLASGALDNKKAKQNGAGAMSAKLSPVAMLILQNGTTRLVSVKNQDVFTKLLDMIPDAVDKFTGGSRVSRAAETAAAELLQEENAAYTDGSADGSASGEAALGAKQTAEKSEKDDTAAETPAAEKAPAANSEKAE